MSHYPRNIPETLRMFRHREHAFLGHTLFDVGTFLTFLMKGVKRQMRAPKCRESSHYKERIKYKVTIVTLFHRYCNILKSKS